MDGNADFDQRHSPLMVSMLEPALLILLKQQPRHGYTLLADLQALGMATLHPSVVYRTLRELEGLEWIISDWDADQTQGSPRRTYRLTGQGEQALRNWQYELKRASGQMGHLIEQIEAIEAQERS
jgi:PadR family transcriptional regulator PadR